MIMISAEAGLSRSLPSRSAGELQVEGSKRNTHVVCKTICYYYYYYYYYCHCY